MSAVVETRDPTAKKAGAVIVTVGDVTHEMDVEAAFDLQRRLLAAVVHIERAQRAVVAKRRRTGRDDEKGATDGVSIDRRRVRSGGEARPLNG